VSSPLPDGEVRAVLHDAVASMSFGLTPGCGCRGCERRRTTIRRACALLGEPLPPVLTDNGAEQEHTQPDPQPVPVDMRPWWDQPGIPGPVD
jgi:hypothetical protein